MIPRSANVIGSNARNLPSVPGLPGLMQPGPIPDAALKRAFPVLLLSSVALLAMACGGKRRPGRGNRLEGAVLVVLFVGYPLSLFYGT